MTSSSSIEDKDKEEIAVSNAVLQRIKLHRVVLEYLRFQKKKSIREEEDNNLSEREKERETRDFATAKERLNGRLLFRRLKDENDIITALILCVCSE